MINELLIRYPRLESCKAELILAKETLIHSYESEGKLLLCGNGGSCADCDHIVGELMKGFLKARPLSEEKKSCMRKHFPQIPEKTLSSLQGGLPAVSLPSFTALNSAFCNDAEPDLVYAQSVLSLGNPQDVLIAISTSGNSNNILRAVEVAKSLGIRVVGLSGNNGGQLRTLADICICVPENETYQVQELHLPVYHYLCAEIERHFFDL